MWAHVGMKQLFARFISQHANHGVVDVKKLPVWRGEEESFLNAVEELAVASLGFATIRDVFEDVNGAGFFFGCSGSTRSRDEKGAAFAGRDVFLPRVAGVATEGAGQRTAGFGDVPQAAHG